MAGTRIAPGKGIQLVLAIAANQMASARLVVLFASIFKQIRSKSNVFSEWRHLPALRL